MNIRIPNIQLFVVITFFILNSCTQIIHSSSYSKSSGVAAPNTQAPVKIFEQPIFSGIGPCEPSISINPNNTQNIVAGSVIDFVHRSEDGGMTWETEKLKSRYGVWGDPVIIADNKGKFYFFHLSDPDGKNWKSDKILDRIVVNTSEDQGNSWDNGFGFGLNPPKQQDKEWAAFNPYNNSLVATWTEFDKYGSESKNDYSRILFSQSFDEGKTWSDAIKISQVEGNAIDDDKTTEGAVPAIGINGEIYVSWGLNEKLYFNKSTDSGLSFQKESQVIGVQKGGWDMEIPGLGRANGMPVTAVDRSHGPNRGTIYVCYGDFKNGKENSNIWLLKSTDNGETFKKPILVNEDSNKKHQFMPWMVVDPYTGYLYFVYYDREKYTDESTDVVFAYSKDGGETFGYRTINNTPFKPVKSVFFGDYNNIDAIDGQIHPIWTQYDDLSKKLSVWTCSINESSL